jgi:anti-sigma factor RsiW
VTTERITPMTDGGHLPLSFLEMVDHLAVCPRCRTRAMTIAMLNELVSEAYGEPATE